MTSRRFVAAGFLAGIILAQSAPASAQIGPCRAGEASPNLPPAGSPPLLRCVQAIVHPEGTQSVDNETYFYYIRPGLQPSLRSERKWVPYNEDDALRAFSRLWRTNFLDDLWIEVIDEPFENDVIGKHVIFHLEERLRLKGIDFAGATEVEISKIEEALKDQGIGRPGGGFVLDESTLIRNVRSVVKAVYAGRGYPNATVEVTKTLIPGGLRLFRLTFDIKAGTRIEKARRPARSTSSRSPARSSN